MVFRTLDGERHEMGGTYRVVEPARRLVYTHQWLTLPERQSLVTIDFVATPDGTELNLLHEQFHDEDVRDAHIQGWGTMLDKLPALLAAAPETAG